jgi:hypothetical protein
MTRQTAVPLDHNSLNPSFQAARSLVENIKCGELILDPPYQRGSVWTLDQRIALVESWLRGLPAGVVILSDRGEGLWNGPDPYATGKGIWACVDGKQRLTTAVMWFNSEFAIPASWVPVDFTEAPEDTEDGPYVRYSGMTVRGQRFLDLRCQLLVAQTKDCATEADEAAFYLLVNGGGTVQTEADMARAANVAGA